MDGILQKYGNKIITDYKVFKKFSPEDKWALLQHWRAQFGNLKIRETWGLNPAAYYAVSNRLKNVLKKNGINPNDGSTKTPRRQRREVNVIEAEFSVQDEEGPPPPNLAAIEGLLKHRADSGTVASVQDEQPAQPFITVEWTNTPDNIQNQLTALANILKFENYELTVKLEVFKNSSQKEQKQ